MRVGYELWKPRRETLAVVEYADSLLTEYQREGLTLTLRQLYYQFVARDSFLDDRTWIWMGSKVAPRR